MLEQIKKDIQDKVRARGWSVRALALHAGVPGPTLAKMMQDDWNPTFNTLNKIWETVQDETLDCEDRRTKFSGRKKSA